MERVSIDHFDDVTDVSYIEQRGHTWSNAFAIRRSRSEDVRIATCDRNDLCRRVFRELICMHRAISVEHFGNARYFRSSSCGSSSVVSCDQNVHISYCDRRILPECRGDRFAYIIERTWKAVDNDCNVSKCVQIIDVVRFFAHLDILPGVCPNPYNANACGYLPIALVGNKDFDVTQINWNSVRLYGIDCSAGPISPSCFQLADVATPFINGLDCNCTDLNGDGRLDLLLRFQRSRINNAFGLCGVPAGTTLTVVVIGKLCNGVQFVAQDCMTLQ